MPPARRQRDEDPVWVVDRARRWVGVIHAISGLVCAKWVLCLVGAAIALTVIYPVWGLLCAKTPRSDRRRSERENRGHLRCFGRGFARNVSVWIVDTAKGWWWVVRAVCDLVCAKRPRLDCSL